jgi:uncharacterized oligopeptide transporter (OPT) family protein
MLIAIIGFAAGLFALTRDFYIPAGIAIGGLASAGIFLTIHAMPLAIGMGYILGPKTSINSWFFGAVVGWAILIPALLATGLDANGAISYVQTLGMGLVLGAGVGFFVAYVLPNAKKIFAPFFNPKEGGIYSKITPIAMLAGTAILFFAGVHPLAAVLAVLSCLVVAPIASRMTGETNIDPLEQFGIIVGLLATWVFGVFLIPLPFASVFLIVCFVAIVAAVAGDIGHDFKSAKEIGTRAKDIIAIDAIAVIVAGIVVPLVLWVIIGAFPGKIFTESMPAMQAKLVAGSIAGFAFPEAFIIGFAFAFVMESIFKAIKKESPVALMAFGIGMFLGLGLAIWLAVGGILKKILEKKGKQQEHAGLLAATGLMGGEGVAGFMLAFFIVIGVPNLLAFQALGAALAIGLILSALYFIRKCKK